MLIYDMIDTSLFSSIPYWRHLPALPLIREDIDDGLGKSLYQVTHILLLELHRLKFYP